MIDTNNDYMCEEGIYNSFNCLAIAAATDSGADISVFRRDSSRFSRAFGLCIETLVERFDAVTQELEDEARSSEESAREYGYDEGRDIGHEEGYDEGRDIGHEEGYEQGFDEGKDEGKEEGAEEAKARCPQCMVGSVDERGTCSVCRREFVLERS
jgi:flagellar biosynthesis/type III secretory pathway protein FliH